MRWTQHEWRRGRGAPEPSPVRRTPGKYNHRRGRNVTFAVQPPRTALRLIRMKNELRAAAGVVIAALLMAGCGSGAVTPPVMAHGVAIREPLADPRPYGAADTAFGLDVLRAWCQADPRRNLVLSPSSL